MVWGIKTNRFRYILENNFDDEKYYKYETN